MRQFLSIFAVLVSTTSAKADQVFRIEFGKDPQRYSESDLKQRVWELERAVSQLQQKVFQIESGKSSTSDTWICTISTMGQIYEGTGGSKAVATSAVIKNCKNGQDGDGFFCKDPKCSQ